MKKMLRFLALLPISLFANWAQEQIREDLAPFAQEGIRQSAVQQLAEQLLPQGRCLHVKISEQGAVSFTSSLPVFPQRELALRNFLMTLAEKHPLPALECIVFLDDCLEEDPLYQAPVFVFAKNRSARQVLIPDFEALMKIDKLFAISKEASHKYRWHKKKNSIFWRGSSSGDQLTEENYRTLPRMKLVVMSKQYPQWLDARFTHLCQASQAVFQRMIKESFPLSPIVPIKEHFAYKYLIDIDGNSCTYARCRWILLSNSVLLKPSSPNIQWYYKTLQPYVHYVPLQQDLSDLPQMYQWLTTHDKEAHRIAQEGHRLAKTLFTQAAIEEYFLTLLNDYAKLYKKSE